MDAEQAARALAEAASALTEPHDVAGALVSLLINCRRGLAADAGAILLECDGRLELLASSSHQMTELEMHQLHLDEGPCVEAHHRGVPVRAHTGEELVSRWPRFGRSMVDAGFASRHATPLDIQGSTVGAMGLFRRSAEPFTRDEGVVADGFAAIASSLLVNLGTIPADQLRHRLQDALDGRVLIEQANGVLAQVHELTMADAYDLLVQSALDRHEPLTRWARQVVDESGPLPRRGRVRSRGRRHAEMEVRSLVDEISILRGLARSLTGMVTDSTPLS